jgi:uncharacterized membrane protein YdjX (TVP38/TMEM64 family)
MIKLDRQSIFQILLIIVLLICGTYLLYSNGIIDLFLDRQRMLTFIHEHRAYAALIFIGMQALQVVAAPIPGEVTGFVGGYLFGTGWGVVYSTIGLTIGSWTAFMIARMLGRHIVERVVSADVMQKYDYVMKHKGLFLAFLMFLVPGFPKDFLSYLLGLGHMGQMSFLLVSTTGRLLGTVLLTVGGSFFRNERYGAFFTVVGIGIAMVLLAMVYRERMEKWFRGARLAQLRRTRRGRKHGRDRNDRNEP